MKRISRYTRYQLFSSSAINGENMFSTCSWLSLPAGKTTTRRSERLCAPASITGVVVVVRRQRPLESGKRRLRSHIIFPPEIKA